MPRPLGAHFDGEGCTAPPTSTSETNPTRRSLVACLFTETQKLSIALYRTDMTMAGADTQDRVERGRILPASVPRCSSLPFTCDDIGFGITCQPCTQPR